MLLIVLAAAARWGFAESIFTSIAGVLAFNFFFLPPVGTFTIADPENWVALTVFLVTAVTASRLSAQARDRAEEATARRADLARLYELSRSLLMDEGQDSVRHSVTRAAQVLGTSSLAFYDRAADRVYGAIAGNPFTPADLERVAQRGQAAEVGDYSAVPVRLGSHVIGTLAVITGELTPEVRDSAASLLAINYQRTLVLQQAAAAEAAKQGEEFKSSLLDALAHDLKTPLTAIRACITHLITTPPRTEEVRQELLSIIDQESERLRLSITDAVELARAESGTLQLDLQVVPVHQLVEGAAQGWVRVDLALIRRAIAHLEENARKYSPPESETEVDARIDDGQVIIRVLDRGPGIRLEDRERVFEKFYRGAGWRDKVEGTGMGLPIAKSIVEAHGGKIRAELREGGGTAMVITLPLHCGLQ